MGSFEASNVMQSKQMELYEARAEILKAMAHPLRLAVAEFLRDGERCVCEIAEHVDSEQSNISRHLTLMVRAGVLANRKQGLKVYYRLRTPCVLNFLECVDRVIREQFKRTRALLAKR